MCNHVSIKKFKSARKLQWHSCINKYFFISVLHLLTLSGRFRVGFGVGYDRALAFRDRPRIFEF